jgi:hypothetical protein
METHVLADPWKPKETAAPSLSPNFHRVQIEDDLDTTATAPEEPRQTNLIPAFKIRSVCGASGRRWRWFGDEGRCGGVDGDQEGRRWRRESGEAAEETGIKATSVVLGIQRVARWRPG